MAERRTEEGAVGGVGVVEVAEEGGEGGKGGGELQAGGFGWPTPSSHICTPCQVG